MKKNRKFYRLLPLALCATAVNVNAAPMVLPPAKPDGNKGKAKTAWKPPTVTVTVNNTMPWFVLPPKTATDSTVPSLTTGATVNTNVISAGVTKTGGGTVVLNGVGNGPIIVNNPVIGVDAPISLFLNPIVMNNGGGTLTLPGVKPTPLPVVSAVPGISIPSYMGSVQINGGVGTLNINGVGTLDLGVPELTSGGTLQVGRLGSYGTINVTGGTLTVPWYSVGAGGSVVVAGTASPGAGTLVVNSGANVPPEWFNSDLDQNGVVNATDFALFVAGASQGGSQASGGGSGSRAVVPEPTSLGLCLAGVLGLISRRRRSHAAA